MTARIWHLKGDTSAAVGTWPAQWEGTASKTWTDPSRTPGSNPGGDTWLAEVLNAVYVGPQKHTTETA